MITGVGRRKEVLESDRYPGWRLDPRSEVPPCCCNGMEELLVINNADPNSAL